MTPQELKNSILQLAIQGRLVPQRPEEGTGEELLREIRKEKDRRIKSGELKITKALPMITDNEYSYEYPDSWKISYIDDIAFVTKLAGFEYTEYIAPNLTTTGIPLFKGKNVQNGRIVLEFESYIPESVSNELKRSQITKKCLLTPYVGTIGNIGIFEGQFKAHLGSNVGKIELLNGDTQYVLEEYVLYYLRSDIGYRELTKHKKATAQESISIDAIRNVIIPIPPLAEQKRIVAKIEELLPYIDRYEKAWSRLEDFNKRFPTDMQKSILQLAIQGKLVPQRPEEGTGEALYRLIQAEKQSLIRSGKLKKEKPLPEITPDEIPFDIPESWKWVRLSELCKSITDGDHQPPPQVPSGIPFLVISNVSGGFIDFSNTRFVPPEYFEALSGERIAEKGDILFTVTGSYGIPVKVESDISFCFQRHMALLKLLLDWDYLFYVLKSPVVREQCDATATGTAQKTVGLNSLRNMLIPLPPHAEQKRIVAKLEELLPLCKRLK